MPVKVELQIDKPDIFYTKLADLHENKTIEESLLINAKLVLMLANQIGDTDILLEIIERVRQQSK